MKRIRFPVEREAVARKVLNILCAAPGEYDNAGAAERITDAILSLLTLPLDEDVLGRTLCAEANPALGRGVSPKEQYEVLSGFYRHSRDFYCGCALAVLTAAGIVVEDE